MDESQNKILKGFLQIGIFIGGSGLVLAFFEPRDSPEFVLSVCSAMIGGLLILGAVILVRVLR